jgi:hypothetical protein
MNADDKRLLRKFITTRAERTKNALHAAFRRQEAVLEAPLKRSQLSPQQEAAANRYNEALEQLAAAVNSLRGFGLDYQKDIPYRPYNERPAREVADRGSFHEKPIEDAVYRLKVDVSRDVEALKERLNLAIKELDRTVDDALLDLLSQDLPGVKETLAKLGEAFDKAALDFGATPEDLSL